MTEIIVHEQIFNNYPSFRRGLIFVAEMNNRGEDAELADLLRATVIAAGSEPLNMNEEPRITVWNEAHRLFGSNPNRFMPAHLALRKRAQKSGVHLPFINKTVALMNLNSIADVIPIGGDDLRYARRRLELRLADGDEKFVPLGEPETVERPEPGEVIYQAVEIGEVMCRRWNWRNGHTTRITEETTSMVINIDGLGVDSEARATATRDRVAQMLERFCHAKISTGMLSPLKPTCQFYL